MSFSLATSEFRTLGLHEKALRLTEHYNVNKSDVAKALPFSRFSIIRLEKAKTNNRDIATNGRPNNLNKIEMEKYIACVQELLENNQEIT
jgi:hypothetical protein